MKNFKRKVSALVLSTLFASMQVSYAAGLSDAAINKIEGGYAGQVAGNGSLDLNFNGNAHVNWDHLNVNKGESLNFNAVGGANGLTILNTVNSRGSLPVPCRFRLLHRYQNAGGRQTFLLSPQPYCTRYCP